VGPWGAVGTGRFCRARGWPGSFRHRVGRTAASTPMHTRRLASASGGRMQVPLYPLRCRSLQVVAPPRPQCKNHE